MPDGAPHFCGVPGCSVLTRAPRCPAHQVTQEHQRRNFDQRTWYRGKRWKALRWEVICEAAYQCALCRKVVDRLDVDHIIKHHGSPDLFWDRRNLQALCQRCHSRKTQQGL